MGAYTLLMLLSDFLQSCISGPDLSSEHQTCMGNGLPGSLQHFHLKISFVIFVCVRACMHMCMRVWMPMQAHAEYGMLVDHIGCFLLLCGY